MKEELAELETLEEHSHLPINMVAKKASLQSELMKILEEEEIYWHKRANSTWFLKGDNNTKFFHKIANEKRGKIHFFVSPRGTWVY